MRTPLKNTLFVLGSAAWLAAAGFGYLKLVRYENTPGAPATPLAQWPPESTIPREATRATLVMVVHPQCSCSEASISELALLMTRVRGLADAHLLFFKPAGVSDAWTKTSLWSAASIIPGVHPRIDDLGREAKLFRAYTSGTVLLYDRGGKLMFNGGITSSRAHQGGNAGRSAIVALLTGQKPLSTRTFVFGCSILGSGEGVAP